MEKQYFFFFIIYISLSSQVQAQENYFKSLNVGYGLDANEGEQYFLSYGIHSTGKYFVFDTGFEVYGKDDIALTLPVRVGLNIGSKWSGLMLTGGGGLSVMLKKESDETEGFGLPYGYTVGYYYRWEKRGKIRGLFLRHTSYLGNIVESPFHHPVLFFSLGYIWD